ncbi:MAG TPA: helix-turn-helix transcriptional regulator [Jatrophihabitantaceae bacterium]|jgi:DNA-binding PadR family transcriptional regulator
MRHALLALLSDGPSYGWKLRQDFEQRTGEVWPVNGGQVYTTLQRLERDGLIESDDAEAEGAQRRFRLTGEGRAELGRWLETPPDLSAPPRDDLVIKVMVAVGVPGIDARGLLQVHRRHLVEVMREYARVKDASPGEARLAMVADAEIFRLDAQVRWLDSVESSLEELSPPAAAPPEGSPRVLLGRRVRVGGRE